MHVLEAAAQVLRAAGQPLHYKAIASRIVEAGIWVPKGKTPQATVNASLSAHIKEMGGQSTFVRVSRGVYGLRQPANAAAVAATPAPRRSPMPKRKSAPQPAKSNTLSFTEAGERVLSECGKGQPMHYRDITQKALAAGWLSTEGKTPEASMYAQILTENKRKRSRGEQPRFVKLGRGFIGLARWAARGLAFQIEQQNRKVRAELLKRLQAMPPADFEELVGRLLAEIGFEDIEVTSRGNDGGIDVRGTLVVGEVIRTKMAVQVKLWKTGNNVQAPVVQQVRGSLGAHEQGLIITTSDFSAGAVKEAARPDRALVALMGGEQLVALAAQYEIGVSRRTHDLMELGEGLNMDETNRGEIAS